MDRTGQIAVIFVSTRTESDAAGYAAAAEAMDRLAAGQPGYRGVDSARGGGERRAIPHVAARGAREGHGGVAARGERAHDCLAEIAGAARDEQPEPYHMVRLHQTE